MRAYAALEAGIMVSGVALVMFPRTPVLFSGLLAAVWR
jgi:hypothetical protein